jgi:AmmeMemoRadiSam system protein A
MPHPLVVLAKDAIASAFTGKEPKVPPGFEEHQGCFVTLHLDGELRGCIGYITSDQPLSQTIPEAARSAAFHDPRFPPLSKEEFAKVTIEVSVLSRPVQTGPDEEEKLEAFEPGVTGLIVRKAWASGLLLPQVFDAETTAAEALAMTCQKAGLPKNAWREKNADVYTFTAKILEE